MEQSSDAKVPQPLKQLNQEAEAYCAYFDDPARVKAMVWDPALFMGIAVALNNPEWAKQALLEMGATGFSLLGKEKFERGILLEAMEYGEGLIGASYSQES